MALLTLMMPTKNRLHTAMSTAQCLAELAGPDVEIVVQDASADSRLGDWIASSGLQSKVAYAHDPTAGSMSANWNLAIRRVSGDYVCIVGDDDGVDPRIVELARWARDRRLSAVSFAHSAYVWKDFPSKHAGKVMLGTYSGRVQHLNGDVELRRVLSSPLSPNERLAQSYHGMASREMYLELERRTGTFFDGLAPDYYTAVMFTALTGNSLAYVDYPFTMHGGSRASNSGRSRSGGLAEHIREYGQFELSDILPTEGGNRSLSILFITQAMLLALQRLDRADLLADFNLAIVYGAALVTNPFDLLPLLRKLRLASQRLGRSPNHDLRALPQATARAAFVLAKSVLIHALPAMAVESRGFRLLPAEDVQDAIHKQTQALWNLKVELD